MVPSVAKGRCEIVNFPGSLDSLSNPTATTNQNATGFEHATQHANANDAIEALEVKVGTGASTPSANTVLRGTGSGTTAYGKVQSGDVDWATIPAARAFHNANQSIANATVTALALNSERYDTDTIHDTATNNSRLTCKTAGKYAIKGCGAFAASATGNRLLFIRLNGVTTLAQQAIPNTGAAQNAIVNIATDYDLAVNDYVELCAFQDSGGALNVIVAGNYSPEFMMARIG